MNFECLIACPDYPNCECGEDDEMSHDECEDFIDEFLTPDHTWFREEE